MLFQKEDAVPHSHLLIILCQLVGRFCSHGRRGDSTPLVRRRWRLFPNGFTPRGAYISLFASIYTHPGGTLPSNVGFGLFCNPPPVLLRAEDESLLPL